VTVGKGRRVVRIEAPSASSAPIWAGHRGWPRRGVANWRMDMRQSMRSNSNSAHPLLLVRCAIPDGRLEEMFRIRYPLVRPTANTATAQSLQPGCKSDPHPHAVAAGCVWSR
jgi:hypothetical protein